MQIDADFVVCSGYKWLLGPYGLSSMYISEKYQEGEPLEYGWMERKNARQFEDLMNYTDGFEFGQLSQVHIRIQN